MESFISEDINLSINIGDEILGGKFKNKRIIVKDIAKNEKGDITINGKPLLRFRIPNNKDKKLICLYIHGLNAKKSNSVEKSLSQYNLIYPEINYNETEEPYQKCLEIIDNNKVDFIIGHSIGGVMAYWLAKEKNIPALLLCPAFGDKHTVFVNKLVKINTPKILAIIGEKDEEVNSKEIKSILSKQPNCIIKKANIGHDIKEKDLKLFANIFVKML